MTSTDSSFPDDITVGRVETIDDAVVDDAVDVAVVENRGGDIRDGFFRGPGDVGVCDVAVARGAPRTTRRR